jgi:hypothetical protein
MVALTLSATIGSLLWLQAKNATALIVFYVITEILVWLFLHKERMRWTWQMPTGAIRGELRTFVWIFAWSNILIWLSTQGSALASARFSTASEYAQLALALSSMRTIIDVVSTPAQQALIPILKQIRALAGNAEAYFSAFMTRLATICNLLVALVLLAVPLATRLLLGPSWDNFPSIAMIAFCALPLLVHSTPDRMWLMLHRLEKLDLKLKNSIALVDTALALLFASLGIMWATIGVSIRSFAMLVVRRRVTAPHLPSVFGKSPLISALPLVAVPFLHFGSTLITYGVGIMLTAISGLQFLKFRKLPVPPKGT